MILVTGADGFIGSHLVEALVARGERVRAFALYNAQNRCGWLDALPFECRRELEITVGDIREADSVRSAMQGCDRVLHLAALIGIPYSYRSPGAYVATNITGTLNLLQAARDFAVERFVHISSSEVYGTAQTVPITEAHPLCGQSPYAATKIAADQLALSFYHSFELPCVVLRPFNTYGPRQSLRAVVPTIITQIAAGKEDISLGSLDPTRDLCFVEDTVSGMLAALDTRGIEGEVIQLGTGTEISIRDLVELIGKVMQRSVRVHRDPERCRPGSSEVQRLLADPSRARALLGWSAVHAGTEGLARGLEKTAAWFTRPEHLELYKVDEYTV